MRNHILFRLSRKLLWAGFLLALVRPAPAVSLQWVRQLGTRSHDVGASVSADGTGSVYISGYTAGNLGGTYAGDLDAFVSKYNAAGSLQWTRQLGASSFDVSSGVYADGMGNVFISGYTNGNLGGTYGGSADAFVSKYDAAGNLQWTRQLGSSAYDNSGGISADGLGNVYISGLTSGNLDGTGAGNNDAFVSKYDANGSLQWTRQLATLSDGSSYRVSADYQGNVYISGSTYANLGGTNAGGIDALISKYDADGNLQWTRQLGTSSDDSGYGVSADRLGNVYISGYTKGSLGGTNTGGSDVFTSKYNAAGNLQWTRQLGTSSDDFSNFVSADGLGNVYISGFTDGSLGGTSGGGRDAFISKYDMAGNLQWTQQLGTSLEDAASGVWADGLNNIYISGVTYGSLGGTNAGDADAFLVKYADTVPEPGAFNFILVVLIQNFGLGSRRRVPKQLRDSSLINKKQPVCTPRQTKLQNGVPHL